MEKLIILGTGHGGVINGVYQTAGKRSLKLDDGRQLLEGQYVREIVKEVIKELSKDGIRTRQLPMTDKDMSLSDRTTLEGLLNYENDGNTILIDVHCNAAGNGSKWMNAHGTEVYYYSKSGQILAERLQKIAVKNIGFYDRKAKYANFHMLRESKSTSILWEIGFMDNKEECISLLSDIYKKKIINTLVQFIKTLR